MIATPTHNFCPASVRVSPPDVYDQLVSELGSVPGAWALRRCCRVQPPDSAPAVVAPSLRLELLHLLARESFSKCVAGRPSACSLIRLSGPRCSWTKRGSTGLIRARAVLVPRAARISRRQFAFSCLPSAASRRTSGLLSPLHRSPHSLAPLESRSSADSNPRSRLADFLHPHQR